MECPDFLIVRVQKFRALPEKDQAAVMKHPDPRGKEKRFADIVRDEQHRFVKSPLQVQKLPLDFHPRDGVKRSERLVHQ